MTGPARPAASATNARSTESAAGGATDGAPGGVRDSDSDQTEPIRAESRAESRAEASDPASMRTAVVHTDPVRLDPLNTDSVRPDAIRAETGGAESAGPESSGAESSVGAAVRAARPRSRPGEGALLRVEILAAAEALLDEAGDESALTLRAVAARTGVSTPAVYRHFADKSLLIAAVCMRVWEALGRTIRDAIAAEEDPFQGLRRGAVAFMRFGLEHPVHYRLLMMGAPRPGEPRPEQEAAMACLRYVAEAVEPCVEAGVLRGDPEQIALRSLALLHGSVALVIAHPYFPWPEDPDEFLEQIARMSGLGSAGLGWLASTGRTSPPVTAEYVDAFGAFAAVLREP